MYPHLFTILLFSPLQFLNETERSYVLHISSFIKGTKSNFNDRWLVQRSCATGRAFTELGERKKDLHRTKVIHTRCRAMWF